MITKNKKMSANKGINPLAMIRKMSIVPVAFIAMYLFALKAASAAEPNVEETLGVELIAQVSDIKDLTSTDKYVFLEHEVLVKPMFNFKSANEGFREYINGKLVYPEEAAKNKIQGRVVLEFIIDIDGSLTDVKIARSAHKILDDEVLRVVKTSPKWTPGEHNGKTVRVKYYYPFTFMLK